MKRIILIITLIVSFCSVSSAQSMSDEQVMQFVMKEYKAGTSQSQIVTKLMQRGVKIEQIRRVRKKYERLKKDTGLGAVASDGDSESSGNRLRTGKNTKNGKQELLEKKDSKEEKPSYRIKDLREDHSEYNGIYDETNPDWADMQDELLEFIPDTAKLLETLLAEKKKKKVFGRDIFNGKTLSFEPNMNIATPQNYKLGPGDAVYIDIYGASQKSIQSTVSPDGSIVIEGFGPVNVSGLTVAQANARLRSTLGARYSSSKIKLSVGETRAMMVNVMGNVKNPGTYTLSAFATVFHALYMAGGTDDLGTLRNIKVFRNNKLVSTVDIYDYMLNGKLTGNVKLADNDVIIVGPYDCLVNITGKVKRPMYYEMKKNESIETIIKYAGGFTGDAYKKQVRVIRKTGKEYSVYNVDEFDMPSFHVADEDSITVDSILPRFSNMVEIKGAVFRPGMYQVDGNINTVKALIEAADGVTEEAFTTHAIMHRMRPDRTLEMISVDVEGILKGNVPDIPLQKEDKLYIPTRQDKMEEQTVTIHGEVNMPGIYKYAANETLEDLILQAGNLKNTASTVKVDVARRVTNPSALATDSIIAKTYSFALKEGFVIDGKEGFTLMPFDEVYVRKSPGFSKQENITVEGEVMFAGTYTLPRKNARLSDLLKSAGGVTNEAYIQGARLERRITPEERIRMEAAYKKAKKEAEDLLMQEAIKTGNTSILSQKDEDTMTNYDFGDTYYVGIELDKAIANPGGDADIVLREGDRIIVPEYNGTVKINGEVMYPNSVGYRKGKSAKYYINQAGGYSSKAKGKHSYIVYMNGMVSKVSSGAKPMPGCEIIVPARSVSKMTIAETMTIGTGVASIATMIATIANLIK